MNMEQQPAKLEVMSSTSSAERTPICYAVFAEVDGRTDVTNVTAGSNVGGGDNGICR